ncbi:Arabinose efflux permease family protein [Magnetospirillum sp. LM-5]|uniref:MFS transporter n=1 Tax=Magnetospirillum sp. LM-5 TaxID=2681466 RepID=UPI00137E80DD|nr:MFS transporter [Magnetospirillum sp. LM-5]CAA7614342.1 Arabinose efflux permease family protein [Magnetospirillum sp. LM-5]
MPRITSTQPVPLPWSLASLSLSMLLPSLGTSIANVALPVLARTFAASFQDVQWIVLAYLLAITTLIVSVGRLADIIGRRRLLLVGIALFSAASVLGGLAPTLDVLIAARAAQGLGAAIMMALSVALVGETVPKARTGSAMGLLATMSAAGTALGPALGGIMVAELGWRAIFLVLAPLGGLTLALARRALPRDHIPTERPGFDVPGTLLLGASLASYALAMTNGQGDFGPLNLALLLASAVGCGLFLRSQTKVASPLIRPAILGSPLVGSSLGMSAVVATVMMATLVVGPFHLAHGLGLPTAMAGLALAFGPVVAALAGLPAGRAVDRLGSRRMMVGALAAMTMGCLALAVIPEMWGIGGYLAPLALVTTGYALFQVANNTAIMTGIHADQRGAVSAMLSLSRNLGLITGASVMGAIFAFGAGGGDITLAAPAAIAAGTRTTFAAATLLLTLALGIAARAHLLRHRTGRGGLS